MAEVPNVLEAQRTTGELPVEAGRYHLYVAYPCPWASHTILMRTLKGLEHVIGMTAVEPIRDEQGWRFSDDRPDPINGWSHLTEAYVATDPSFTGWPSVPVLWDKRTSEIVSNESWDIAQMFNSEFNALAERPELDFYPEPLRAEIDELSDWVRNEVTHGYYRTVFARSQTEYDENVTQLLGSLDWIDRRLESREFLVGSSITAADWLLAMALFRIRMIELAPFERVLIPADAYPQIRRYAHKLYTHPGVAKTVRFDEIRANYTHALTATTDV